MPINAFDELERACGRLGRRRPAWLSHPSLDGIDTIDELVDAIRSDKPNAACSDRTIRAVAALCGDPDVLTVLLHALAGLLQQRLNHPHTDDYLFDSLGDLTLVVLDAIHSGNLDHCDHLAHRLANRAHNRSHKRTRRISHRGVERLVTIQPMPPQRISQLEDDASTELDRVGDTAVARADLGGFIVAIRQAIDAEELPADMWTDFRDHRLRRVFVSTQARTSVQRAATSRAARHVQPYIDTHLTSTAA